MLYRLARSFIASLSGRLTASIAVDYGKVLNAGINLSDIKEDMLVSHVVGVSINGTTQYDYLIMHSYKVQK